ncbi:MAG: hypothetical protein JWR27_1170, partial [Aeromicrobium sp.]|nr:hypothetical protein [Aeromicrobium sp.]
MVDEMGDQSESSVPPSELAARLARRRRDNGRAYALGPASSDPTALSAELAAT